MPKVKYGGKFWSTYQKLVIKYPELKATIKQKIGLFSKNPNDTRLENHDLKRDLKNKFAFSITNDIRIVYQWTNKTTAFFLAIGTHKEVYSKNL